MADVMQVPQGAFNLVRLPVRPRDQLRAWNAADEYLLAHIAEQGFTGEKRVLVVNDGFGALGVALAAAGFADVVSWSDSITAHRALAHNLAGNGLAADSVLALASTDEPQGRFDLILLKGPKHNSLLEDQLHRLRPALREGSVVIGADMAKHIHTSTLELFERIIGPTKTSLARKKARLAFVDYDAELSVGQNPWPQVWRHDGLEVTNRSGVFSARSLDIGTRLLLDHLPQHQGEVAAVDLGCGNGIVGATFLARNPEASCLFIDESYGAVASATATVEPSLPSGNARFVVANDLTEIVEPSSIDLVLCNPPFHDSVALSGQIASQMFKASRAALRPGGQLIVVGNRHLGYHAALKRIFGNCETIGSNAKFVVLQALR